MEASLNLAPENQNGRLAEKGLHPDIRGRLKSVIDRYGGPKMISEKCDIPLTTLHAALRGANDPRASMLAAIAWTTRCSLDWLMFGQAGFEASPTGFSEGSSGQPEIARGPLYRYEELPGGSSAPTSVNVTPIIGALRDLIQLSDVALQSVLLLTMEGDASMPLLSPGDVALVDRTLTELRDGAICAIDFDGEPVVKRIERVLDGSIVLKPCNPAYESQHVPSGEVGGLKVVGRVRGTIRRL